MRVLDGALSALLLGPTATFAADALASSVLFTTIRINTGVCTPTGPSNGSGGNTGGNSTSGDIESKVSTDYGTYDFQGFYPNVDPGTALKTTTSSGMTLEVCGSFCGGSAYFDVQNGNQCLCFGDPPSGTPESSADPSTPCPGNKAEVCGAPGFGIVYGREGGSGSLSSTASNGGPVTVVVTGVTTDTAGTHTFTSTEVVSAATTTTAITGTPSTVPSSISGSGTEELSTSSAGATSSSAGASSTSGIPTSSAGASSGASSSSSASSSAGSDSSSSAAGVSSSTGSSASSSTTNVASSSSASPSASATGQPTAPCPAADGQVFTDANGNNYVIACNTNYEGLPNPNDLPATDARTFEQCLSDCDTYVPSPSVANGASCVAVTFGIGGTNACYLKFQVETVQSNNPGFDSARKQSYVLSSVSYTSGSSTPAVSSSSGVSSSTGSVSVSGSSSTLTGSSSSSSSASSSSVSSISVSSTSVSSTSVSSTSASSSSVSTSVPSSSVSSTSASSTVPSSTVSSSTESSSTVSSSSTVASSSTSSTLSSTAIASTFTFGPEPTIITSPVCPTNNNTVFTDYFGYPYYIKCGLQIDGDNLYPVHADTFYDCLEYCDIIIGCAAVTYLDGASSTNANCFPYSSFRGYTTGASDIYSGVPQNGTSEGYPDATGNLCGEGYNQSVFNDVFGYSYFIGCDQNVAGSGPPGGQDLRAYVADDLEGCLTYCSMYDTCIAVDFTGYPVQPNAANCYPKYSTGAITYQPGTQLAIFQD